MRLEGKVAVVTGAAGGQGREAARLFAGEGARLVVADIDGEEAEKAAEQIPALAAGMAFNGLRRARGA